METDKYRELFLEESQEHIDGLKQFLEAKDFSEKAREEAYRHAHSLKGMAATMGINDIVKSTHLLEEYLSKDIPPAKVSQIEKIITQIEKTLEEFENGNIKTSNSGISFTGGTNISIEKRKGMFRVEIFFSSSLPMPVATVFKFIRDASKKLEVIETNQRRSDLKKGIFNNPLIMLVNGETKELEELIKETPGILGIKISPIDTAELSQRKLNLETIKVKISDLDVLLENIHQLFQLKNQLKPILMKGEEDSFYQLEMYIERLHELTLNMRMVPLKLLEEGLRNLVITYASEMRKKVSLIMVGSDVKIDKNIADRLLSILTHIVKNAIYHGIETPEERIQKGKSHIGIIKIEAENMPDSLEIRISDDGKGIQVNKIKETLLEKGILSKSEIAGMDKGELIQYIFKPNFSTSKKTGFIAGRGVGLDAVKEMVEKMYGVIFVETEEGKGTTFTLRLPRALIIQNLITIILGDEKIAVPTYLIEGVTEANDTVSNVLEYRGEEIPIKGKKGNMILIFKDRSEKKAFYIEEIYEMDFQLVRELPAILRKIPYLLGYYIDEEGPVFMVHPGTLWNYLPEGILQ